LLILQHPSEQKQALATVSVLKLCIEPLDVLVGETFEHLDIIQSVLKHPEACRVLFPHDGSGEWDMSAMDDSIEPVSTLIVIDGTWRKAKRIWHLNPWLAQLPCVYLSNVPDSQYQIRASSIQGGVSTLEAVMYGCDYLSGTSGFNDLLKPFNAMIDMQIKKMGPEVFLAHYGKQQDE
jgi:DTW domain-containing protein YfiP